MTNNYFKLTSFGRAPVLFFFNDTSRDDAQRAFDAMNAHEHAPKSHASVWRITVVSGPWSRLPVVGYVTGVVLS